MFKRNEGGIEGNKAVQEERSMNGRKQGCLKGMKGV